MKVVITGGAGFIGLRLAQRLLEIGELVGPSGRPERIKSARFMANFCMQDCTTTSPTMGSETSRPW